MPDPVMQLTEQHNRMRRLFKQMPHIGGHQAGDDRAKAICELLRIHSKLEEEIIYPVIKRMDEGLAGRAYGDHEKADELVERIIGQEYANNTEVRSDLDRLEQDVEEHARWEEAELLPKISALDPDEVEDLGRRLYQRNQELLHEFPGALETSAETEGFTVAPRI